MKALAEAVFIGEIVNQAKIANRAAERLKATKDQSDHFELWCSIQSILIASGNVSKILWPSRESSKARGNALRAVLGVDDQNLLSDRKFRNHFEHYDERIEDWVQKTSSLVYSDSSIDPFEPKWSGYSSQFHRAYNPRTQTLKFRGESFDLAALLKALDEIRLKCRPFVLP